MTQPAIEIQQLRKVYEAGKAPAKEALKGIDLTIPRGSFFGLLGPNGAGKSTLINILSGLVAKTSGVARINGYDIVGDMRHARLSLGVVPQELILDTFFTVRQALEIHAGYYGVPKSQRRTDELIEAMGLADKADVSSRRLSGGMRRRLLIAKALVHNPPVLILDEPTAGVDVELRQQLWNYVRKLNRAGTTVLLTTHYLEEAEQLCDEIAIINHGTLIARESKEKLMQGFDSKELIIRPATALTHLPKSLLALGAELDEKGRIHLRYQPSSTGVDSLLELLRAEGIGIADLSTQEADLERIFRTLTAAPAA
jgi:ABC-2 type transport system ATP-binding protein